MVDILKWPSDLTPQENEFYLETVTRKFESPFSGASQTIEFPGAKWVIKLKFKNLTREKMRRLEVTLLQLRGAANRIKIPDHATHRAGVGGSAIVDGSGQLGRVLMIKNAPPGKYFLKTGDYFEINGELKRVVADSLTDAEGKTALRFEPALRKAPPANAAIETNSPGATVRMKKDDGGKIKRVPFYSSVSLDFIEDINR